ncbi:hypothetical protein GGI17_006154 [Coemansia sp. S146]|nr:hypothetical protein GGI17_006154 [Coemansia sp. S146]
MASILAHIFNIAFTSAGHWREKVISVVHAATRAVFQFTSNCTDPGPTFKTAPESSHLIIDIQNTHTSTETKHIDKADTEPFFVISIEPIYDCNACTGLDVENTDKIVAATPAVNDSGDETAIDFVSDTDRDSTSNAAFDANTEYSDDYTLATDKVAMATKTCSGEEDRHNIDSLDTWTIDVLEWAGCSKPTASDGSQNNSDSEYSDSPKSYSDRADKVAPYFKSLLLSVAHHIKAYLSERVVAGFLKPEDCRLILPVVNEDIKAKRASIYPVGNWDYKAFAHAECGMFPLSSCVERQVAPAPHTIVANVEIAADSDGFDEAVQLLTAKATELFPNQHNRRFAWGLTASWRAINAYVFGPDDQMSSAEIDINNAGGAWRLSRCLSTGRSALLTVLDLTRPLDTLLMGASVILTLRSIFTRWMRVREK